MKQRPKLFKCAVAVLVFAPILLPVGRIAHAQVARVAAFERTTEKNSGGAAPWLKAKIGTTLDKGHSIRTRKRSKADILFVDKSLIRLGALSTLHVENDTDATLDKGGQLLFSRLKPGRIIAGPGTAGITGSVGIIQHYEDGSARFTLITGAMKVTSNINGDSRDLQPGQSVVVYADGALSALRVAAPLIAGGRGNFGPGAGGGNRLAQAPVNSPYAGSTANFNMRSSPERIAADQGSTASNSVVAQNANPFQVPGGLPQNPPIVVFPAALRRAALQGRQVASLASTTGVDMPTVPTTDPAVLSGVRPIISGLDTGPASNHIEDAMDYSRGSGIADFEMIGALGDGGTLSYGGRLHTFFNKGAWSVDMALLPLKLRFNSPAGRTTRDISALSSATLTYTSKRLEVEVGRQRFLSGPTQAALFGSMIRQGARDTMDALRVSPNIGKNRQLDLAYLYDAFPRNLPYQVPGAQKGLYGRFGLQTPRANFGLNLLKYNNLSVSSTVGATVDFAMPIIADKVEFYGELGRDPFRRGMVTTGLTFPGLYERTDFDVYLETATLKKWGSTAPTPPTEYSMRVYRRLNKNSNLVLQLQKFYHSQGSVTIGFSYGGRILFPRG